MPGVPDIPIHPPNNNNNSQKLAEIDAHYGSGRFEVDHQFPEGQVSRKA